MTITRPAGNGTPVDFSVIDARSYGLSTLADAATNTAAILAAAAVIPASGGTLLLRPGVYATNAIVITGKDGLIIDGPGAVLTCPTGNPLTVQGSRTSSITTVTANITVGANTITVASSAGLAVGDMLCIWSDTEVWNPERPDQYFKGELAVIAAISGTTVTLVTRTYDSYATASGTINVDKITPVKNITIRGIRAVGGGAGQTQYGIQAFLFDNATISNCTVDSCERTGVLGRIGTGFNAYGNFATRSDESGLGYGVRALGVDGAQLHANRGRANRHTIDVDWERTASRNVSVQGNIATNDTSAGISTHGGAELCDVEGNFTRHCGGGLAIRSRFTRVAGNHILGTRSSTESSQSYLHGITIGDDGAHPWGVGIGGYGLQLIDNHINLSHPSISNTTYGIYATVSLKDAQIIGNKVAGTTGHGILLKGDWVDGALIADNTIDCASQAGTFGTTFSHGIYIAASHSTVSGNNQKHLRIQRNDIRGAFYSAIRVDGNVDTANRSDDIVVSENVLRGFGQRGVDLLVGYFNKGRVDRNIYPDGTGTQLAYVLGNWTTSPEPSTSANIRDITGLLTVGEETIPRVASTASTVAHPGTGVLWLTFFTARKTGTTSSVRINGGSTAAGATPTLLRVGLYEVQSDNSLTLVASIASDTTMFSSTFQTLTKSFTASYTRTAGTRYAIGLLVVSGAAMPNFYGASGNSSEWGQDPMLCSQVSSQTDLPSTIASGSLSASTPGRALYAAITP